MKEPTFARMGEYVYHGERLRDGQPVIEHPFNNPRYAGGSILIVGANYGTGSSREHAPQGLYRFGIRGIIAESYADIFDGNCATIGIAAVKVGKEDLEKFVRQAEIEPGTEFVINLITKSVWYQQKDRGGIGVPFDIPEGTRQALITGSWDALSVLQGNEDKIREIEKRLSYLKFR